MFKRNSAIVGFGIGHFINATTGATVTTGTPTCKRTLDGTGGACANAASYNSDGAVWEIDLEAADMNGDVVVLSFTLADCLPISYTIRTGTKLVSELNDLGGTAQSGDVYAIANSGTHGNAALKTLIDAVNALATAVKAKTDNLPASPAAVGSLMGLANDAITAAKVAAGALDGKGDWNVGKTDYTLSSAQVTALVAAIEAEIADDATGEAVKQAIVAKLIENLPDLDDLTLAAIGDAARDAILNRVLSGNHDTAGSVGKVLQDVLVDTAELQTNQGNWATATGFSTHSVSDIVTALQAVAADFKATGYATAENLAAAKAILDKLDGLVEVIA